MQPSATVTLTPTATLTPTPIATLPSIGGPGGLFAEGLLILSLTDYGYTHIFAYQPQSLPLTRLTDGPWHDISPALSPSGDTVVFASQRDGQWDLYLLELATGIISRLTNTPEYESAPSWSPDGLWLVYEAYVDNNLELFIQHTDGLQDRLRLTFDGGADHSPAWSPRGRQIAFVSTRTGESEIWLADLDSPASDRFTNLSRSGLSIESHPAWSPDGSSLAWSSVKEGFQNIFIWQTDHPQEAPRYLGNGDWPIWSPSGNVLLTRLRTPNHTYLSGFSADGIGLSMAPISFLGEISGMTWGDVVLPWPLPDSMAAAADLTPIPLWESRITTSEDIPPGRYAAVELQEVDAPYPLMSDRVDEAFVSLREKISAEVGWDLLSSLDNAYVPLTTPLSPGMETDWLYTGRAFALNPLLANTGWMVMVREDYGPETYWRIYLRSRIQDGSIGQPLHELPWDMDARFSGDPSAYEEGGALFDKMPTGYWIDFTQLAIQYGWERLPALPSWIHFYPGSQFNKLAHPDGLDWDEAMLEFYPPEILLTPTPIPPATETPSAGLDSTAESSVA